MKPVTVTLTSSGSSPWKLVNWNTTPINIGFGIVQNSSTAWQIDMTMEDPTFIGALNSSVYYPNSSAVTIFSSIISGSSVNVLSNITFPIAAWRLTVTSVSTDVASPAVSATALQAGIG